MKLQTYSDPAAFLARAQAALEARETINNLILGVSMRLCEHPDWTDHPPYQAVIEDESGEIALVAVITPPANLLLAETGGVTPAHFDLLIDNLCAGKWPFPGVMTEMSLAERFAQRWEQVIGQPYQQRMRLRAYELREVIWPTPMPSGRLRQAGVEEQPLLDAWRAAFVKESLHQAPPANLSTLVARHLSAGNIFIWEDQGQPVSTAMRTRPTRRGHTVGSVYTPPELRGRGYASVCVAALSQLMLDSGKAFCNLFTDLDYPTSNKIYQQIGYRPVADFAEYKIGNGD